MRKYLSKISLVLILCLFTFDGVYAQISITDSITVQQVKDILQGEGVVISNLQITSNVEPDSVVFGTDTIKYPAYGIFEDEFGVLGMNRGLIMTNGSARNAIGPNNHEAISQHNSDSAYSDTNLINLVDTSFGLELMDACVIEFDIEISSSVLVFNYIFASEEYPEFLGFNDVFGFFISGPGITGTQNIALVPGTTIPVSVSAINHTSNSQYYVNNGNGTTPFDNLDLQYDGYTTVLQARSDVIPCQTYHIILAIADASDNVVDSGVFLEENSFSSGISPELSVRYEHTNFNAVIEGCNKGWIIVERNRFNRDLSNPITYKYEISGSAENGIDYSTISDSIVLDGGELKDSILIEGLEDGIFDDNELVTLTFFKGCGDSSLSESISIPIREFYNHPLDSAFRCGNEQVQLNANPNGKDSLSWLPSTYLSCTDCQSPWASNPSDTLFWFNAYDRVSGCRSYDSVYVTALDLKLDFDFHFEQCYTTIDVFFDNLTTSANRFWWSFGDGNTSTEVSPQHTYKVAGNQTGVQYFEITLIGEDSLLTCSDTLKKSIAIQTPFLIPNIVTPNGDGYNDFFEITGINTGAGCWSLSVTNRWGVEIFKSDDYDNKYGFSDAPDGVYYYYLKNNWADREFKGTVQLIR